MIVLILDKKALKVFFDVIFDDSLVDAKIIRDFLRKNPAFTNEILFMCAVMSIVTLTGRVYEENIMELVKAFHVREEWLEKFIETFLEVDMIGG